MKNILNIKVILGALTTASVLLCATLAYILWIGPAAHLPDPSAVASPVPAEGLTVALAQANQALGPVSAALTLIPAPTSTPRYVAPTPTPPLPAASSFVVTPTPLPGTFTVGVYVQISGTEGQGLRLRAKPGLNSPPLFLGHDSEAFLVTDGPQQADGHTWWYLTAPYDQTRSGWAVQDYLSVIPSP
ncbi:MAG: hypothetical protein QMD04_03785 [Anaerolineales bacterium]|nr:hypothetical protein [Anaerolineales bacterium]